MKHHSLIGLVILLLTAITVLPLWAGTTGKIAGTIIDKQTSEPLPGTNIIVIGTPFGASADMNGNFSIIHVPPGSYELMALMMGYRKVTITQVRVLIDQTARVNVALEPQTIEAEELTVIAERNLIKEDVATSTVAVSARELEELPVTTVESVVGLQAGIQGGMTIRGSGSDNALLMLDGITMRDPRNNQPVSKVALSAVQEISVERGGFNAEYGHVQSGIVNVITKEGGKSHYTGSISAKFSPPAAKYWQSLGVPDVQDPNSYWLRPYFDDAVCWTGTGNGAWDEITRRQYPEWMGWNAVSKALCSDNDPNNDLTPLAAQRVFMYETRKMQLSDRPDYDIDGGFGGPVPFIHKQLGNLRFFTSYRQNRQMLLWPLARPDYRDYDYSMQVNSDITPSMRLRFSFLQGKQYTIESNWAPGYYPRSAGEIADVASSDPQPMFADWNFCLADIDYHSMAGKLTHTLNSKTFYEVSLEQLRRNYNTRPTRTRNTQQLYEIIPGYYRDENPFGYWPTTSVGFVVGEDKNGARARDFTVVNATTFKADLTSQINFNNLIKTGIEVDYNDLNFDYGLIELATAGKSYASRVQMRVFPIRASMYLQDKMESKGFTMNAGVRLDYSDSKAEWWAVKLYDPYFYTSKYNSSQEFPVKKSEPQWQVSPRLGISHPITVNSKLFFNYGHFKQMPQYETLFRVQRSSDRALSSIGDPNLILAKTISYELGYDHLLLNDILLQLAAYYNDISDQQDQTLYRSIMGVSYSKTTSNRYEDIRGFEVTLRKTSGQWFSGFANYTYQVSTSGHFNRARVYEDPSLQKQYDEATINMYQDRPLPRPYARASINFSTPEKFGPFLAGQSVLGGFMLNLILDWQAGNYITWNPKGIAAVSYNVKSVDYFNSILRLTKTLDFKKLKIQLIMDMYNAFNTLRMSTTSFAGGYTDYIKSLHLPKNIAYDNTNIPGKDKYGDYRKPGVEFQPMELQGVIDRTTFEGKNRVIYYEAASKKYLEFIDKQWIEVDKSRIDKILKDKAYIDMPNATTFAFLDPRQIFFGIRVSFDLNR